MPEMPTIGVFDSGVGGLSLVHAIETALPGHEIIYRTDKEHLPYGNKTPQELLELSLPILQGMVDEGCDIIVIACNTVTTVIAKDLRTQIKVPLIGMEPMIKPAAGLTKCGIIAVCATPATLASERYKWLKDTYAEDVQVLEPDCSDWSEMIETEQVDRKHVHDRIEAACEAGADIIVLGCTHFHWIEDIIKQTAGNRATVLQPEQPVMEELKRVLEQLP